MLCVQCHKVKEKGQLMNRTSDIFEFFCRECIPIQPERSKREDLIDQIQEELIERSKLNIEIVKAQLGCGALNSMET